MCEICSKLTIKPSKRRHWQRSGVFIVKFEQISDGALVLPLLALSMQMPAGQIYEKSVSVKVAKYKIVRN